MEFPNVDPDVAAHDRCNVAGGPAADADVQHVHPRQQVAQVFHNGFFGRLQGLSRAVPGDLRFAVEPPGVKSEVSVTVFQWAAGEPHCRERDAPGK